jgi:hypothetical protein
MYRPLNIGPSSTGTPHDNALGFISRHSAGVGAHELAVVVNVVEHRIVLVDESPPQFRMRLIDAGFGPLFQALRNGTRRVGRRESGHAQKPDDEAKRNLTHAQHHFPSGSGGSFAP